jgi:CRISPR-associated exonuclease Cas4
VFAEDELLPISALQHLVFCERQCALIHIERAWSENRLTVEGRHLHEKAHDGPDELRPGVRVTRGLPLRSFALGITGIADVVEFQEVRVPDGLRAYPIEYKRGSKKNHEADRVQLCAQAMCLEEMLPASIPEGALFYGTPRRREIVSFEGPLRELTRKSCERLHALIASGRTPRAVREPKCKNCSLAGLCLPGMFDHGTANSLFARALHASLVEAPAEDRDP